MNDVATTTKTATVGKRAPKQSPREQAASLVTLIQELLEPVAAMHGDSGTCCGRLADLAHEKLDDFAFTTMGQHAVYCAQAMIHGAMRCSDATPSQEAVLLSASANIDALSEMMDAPGMTDAERPPSAPARAAGTAAKPEQDYLGHANATTEAFDRFSSSVDGARKQAAADPRSTARMVGIHLLELNDRTCHTLESFDGIIATLPGDTDSDGARALLEMAKEYQLRTCNVLYDFAGEVLTSLEQGGLA